MKFDRDGRRSYRNCDNCLHSELTLTHIFDSPAILTALQEIRVLFSSTNLYVDNIEQIARTVIWSCHGYDIFISSSYAFNNNNEHRMDEDQPKNTRRKGRPNLRWIEDQKKIFYFLELKIGEHKQEKGCPGKGFLRRSRSPWAAKPLRKEE
ncbi:uncharacterized protein TNCV_3573551 [Trichonephila clavipes]|nr:uncharacterized protein TNCV_3573551 [Trichonephila clavipes]